MYGTELRYKCDVGFNLVGDSKLTCGSNQNNTGQWIGTQPYCKRESMYIYAKLGIGTEHNYIVINNMHNVHFADSQRRGGQKMIHNYSKF